MGKIESELIPEIERLRLDIMSSVNLSLSKIYSGVLDGLIEAKDEEKIKTEFIPKVNSLGLDSEAKRAQEFLDEQEQLRKEEEERKRREEERKRREEERKAEEARKEAERKAAEEERLRKEKEEEEKRLAILKAEREAAEK